MNILKHILTFSVGLLGAYLWREYLQTWEYAILVAIVIIIIVVIIIMVFDSLNNKNKGKI